MTTTVKPPVIVVVSIDRRLEDGVKEWLTQRNLLTAERVFPKKMHNLGLLSAVRLFSEILERRSHALRGMASPEKYIIISSQEEAIVELQDKVSAMSYYEPKLFEFYLAVMVTVNGAERVGFFVPHCPLKKGESSDAQEIR